MNNKKKLANQTKIVLPKSCDYIKNIKMKLRKEQVARLAAQKNATRLVDTTGIIDWPKSRGML